ncbi:MAG TPA: biotin/lipoyl-containing protein [Candidatus Baltobacteraceae bacterium]|jgi:biotin carboxyl carrier protein|nr:biotin/lipoyl-containing protein [Candidatus Baltobacteraceae bacterium]
MPNDADALADRVRRLAEFLAASDALRVRIEREDEDIEVARYGKAVAPVTVVMAIDGVAAFEPPPLKVDAIKADLVGIFRLSRPTPLEGELLATDRELAFVEALGMRNPVRSLGGGRIVSIAAEDGAAVEYGQPLFLVDRG